MRVGEAQPRPARAGGGEEMTTFKLLPESGHFAVEDCLEAIAQGIRDFYAQQVRADHG